MKTEYEVLQNKAHHKFEKLCRPFSGNGIIVASRDSESTISTLVTEKKDMHPKYNNLAYGLETAHLLVSVCLHFI